MCFNLNGIPKFQSAEKVDQANETKYLGTLLSKTHDLKSEVSQRMSACMAIFNKMHVFWKKWNCPKQFKMCVFDAVIRSKLVYGLDVVHVPNSIMQKLDAFQ